MGAMTSAAKLLRLPGRLLLLEKLFVRRAGPKAYARLAGYAFKKAFLGNRTPLALMVAVTYRCQCRCVHCSAGNLRAAEMPPEALGSIITQAADAGVVKLGLTGGEPLLYSGLEEAVRLASARGMSVSLDTNGLLLDRQKALALKKAGVTIINVSLDSALPRAHDRLRASPGCFEKAASAVRCCAAAGIPCVVSTYATERRIHNGALEEVIKLASELGADAVRVMFPVHAGRLAGRGRELLKPEGKRIFFEDLMGRYPFVYSESPLFDFLSGRVECSMRKGLSVYMKPDGDLLGCYASGRTLGNALREPLAGLLEKFSGSCGALEACNLVEGNPHADR